MMHQLKFYIRAKISISLHKFFKEQGVISNAAEVLSEMKTEN